MRLTILGSSGSLAAPDNPASGYLLEVDNAPGVVLDLGPGTLARLQRFIDPASVHVLFSHLHADHCLDFPSLMVWRRFHPDAPAVARSLLYAPKPAPVFFGRLSSDDQPDGVDDLSDTFAFTPWRAHQPEIVDRVTVTPYPMVHPVEAYALRVEEHTTGATLAYSGDTAYNDQLVEAARDVDLFLCEANWGIDSGGDVPGMHMNGVEAGRAARLAGAKRLVIIHVPPWVDKQATVAAAAAEFGGPVEFGDPGTVYTV
ncbi:MBL fold metallo-hydrolase [Corynebacterium frankenforstense]